MAWLSNVEDSIFRWETNKSTIVYWKISTPKADKNLPIVWLLVVGPRNFSAKYSSALHETLKFWCNLIILIDSSHVVLNYGWHGIIKVRGCNKKARFLYPNSLPSKKFENPLSVVPIPPEMSCLLLSPLPESSKVEEVTSLLIPPEVDCFLLNLKVLFSVTELLLWVNRHSTRILNTFSFIVVKIQLIFPIRFSAKSHHVQCHWYFRGFCPHSFWFTYTALVIDLWNPLCDITWKASITNLQSMMTLLSLVCFGTDLFLREREKYFDL